MSKSLQGLQDRESIAIICYSQQQIKPANTIIFTEEFDGIISNIPEGVEHIQIRKIKRFQNLTCLPKSLKTLYIESVHFGKVELPDSLEYLELEMSCTVNIAQWPKSLKSLSVYNTYMSSMPPLPESLEYLRLIAPAALHGLKGLPKSLKTLIVPWSFGENGEVLWLKDLHNLEHFEFSPSRYETTCEDIVNYLPPGIKILKGLKEYINKDPSKTVQQGRWPDSLECIKGRFNYKGPLPKCLKILKSSKYEITDSILPESLEYLCVSSIKGEAIKAISQLPNLKTLICDKYNPSYEKDVSFPSSLEHLEIRSSANNITSFPDNLKTLIIPITSLPNVIRLPEKLETLRLNNSGVNLDIYLPSELNKITFAPY
jgi:hypothetical protein